MKIIGGTDKDKEDEARKRADALAKAIIKMLPQHLSHRELLAALSSVLATAFAEDGTREGVLRAMRDLTTSVLAEFAALKRRQRLGQRHIPEEDGDDPARSVKCFFRTPPSENRKSLGQTLSRCSQRRLKMQSVSCVWSTAMIPQ